MPTDRGMQRVGRRYTAEFNRGHGHSGTVWSGRFRATVLQPENCFMAAMCHVESDAALAGDGRAAEAERISSVAHHLGLGVDPLVTDHALFWALGNTPFERQSQYRESREHTSRQSEEAAFNAYLAADARDAFERVMQRLFADLQTQGMNESQARESAEHIARTNLRARFRQEHPEFRNASSF